MNRLLLILLFFVINTIAFSQQNNVVAWGRNIYGQLNIPVGLDSVVEITSGIDHNLALKSNGTVVAWGNNREGKCNVPEGLDSVIAIEAGLYHSLVLRNNGKVVVWGSSTMSPSVLNKPEDLDSVVAISLRNRNCLALRSNGKVVQWGEYQNLPLEAIPAGLDSVIAVAAGTNHSVALRKNGKVVAWGKSTLTTIPEEVDSIVAIVAGITHTLALDANGTLYSWGESGFNQEDIPLGVGNIRLIAAGTERSIVLKDNGDILTWIKGGVLDVVPTCMKNVKSIAAGLRHYVALTNESFFATVDKHVVCDSLAWIDGKTYTASNDTALYTFVGGDINGCDSTVRLDLTVLNDTAVHSVEACESYTWLNGETYFSSNDTSIFIMKGASALGCDSVIRLDLTITNATARTDIITACDSLTWIDGNTYTLSNDTVTYTLTNAAGCDSVVTLNLTITNSTFGTDIITTCDSLTWIDGNTYTSSNETATYILTNSVGCDSIVTLDLAFANSTGIDVVKACDSLTWIDGNTYTMSNDTVTYILTNAAGCDSVVTLKLTIFSLSDSSTSATLSSETIKANNTNAMYQWLDCDNENAPISEETSQYFTATTKGNYAVEITENGCVDTSACVEVVSEIPCNPLKIDFYPNPSHQIITFQVNCSIPALKVKLFNSLGQWLSTHQLQGALPSLQLPENSGLYLLEVSWGEKHQVQKVVKY